MFSLQPPRHIPTLPQFPPPSYVRGMNRLASMPDTSVADCWPRQGVPRSVVGRITPATGAPQKPAAGAGDHGFGFGPKADSCTAA
jgi:hypothetical protein